MASSKDRLEDMTLGAFAYAPQSDVLDHAVRFLSSWGGSDKLFMIIQYSLKIIIPVLNFRARLQHKAGMNKDGSSSAATALAKLYGIIGDSRMLWRFFGLLSIYQWMTGLERSRPPTRKLLSIERLQGWSMLLYYPLEHLYYLRAHAILPLSFTLPFALPFLTRNKKLTLDINKLGLWSTRFWAAYVFLQLAHLSEDFGLLKLRERAVSKIKGKGKEREDGQVDDVGAAERAELSTRRSALTSELITQLGYLPLTVHWSLEQGLFKNDIWVGIFGLIAGVASFHSGWKATALTPAEPPAPSTEPSPLPMDDKVVSGFDAAIDSAMANVTASQEVGGSLVVVT